MPTTTDPSPQERVFRALANLADHRRSIGATVLARDEAVHGLLQDPAIAALATDRAAVASAPHNTPQRWLGNQFDFFTGHRWGRTPHHAGLGKHRVGRYWAIDLSRTAVDRCGAVPDVR